MITDPDEAANILSQIGSEDMEPDEFWKSVGWDVNLIHRVAAIAETDGMGDQADVMTLLQMGAVMTVIGLGKRARLLAEETAA
jgi:hypothetical protein